MIASILNFAGPDMIVILLIVLVLFGAKKLPDLARGFGQAINEFHKAKDDLVREREPAILPGDRSEAPSQLVVPSSPASSKSTV